MSVPSTNVHERLRWLVPSALVWFAADQATKAWLKQALTPGVELTALNGAILVTPVNNPGAFLSIGAGLDDHARGLVFTVGVALVLAALLAWSLRAKSLSRMELLGAGSFLGGGLGNLLDRLVQGGTVFDFLNLGIGSVRTGIFNVADVGLMVGVALFVVGGLLGGQRRT
ncbi:signal peptidase II [Nitrospirillum amazonense]|uniref:Lipoprotein signal peptidase n=1 Tax=Nitrospirillum amazonense TaxID=28077 RepID=A0A560FIR2_9PROT|nr:signal peptidase II [Nitrospirillum amazonense]TWB21485.1 signal peptidase II [Nitrospirillum amazonense]